MVAARVDERFNLKMIEYTKNGQMFNCDFKKAGQRECKIMAI